MQLVKEKNQSELVGKENNMVSYIRKSSKWTSKEDTLLIQNLISFEGQAAMVKGVRSTGHTIFLGLVTNLL